MSGRRTENDAERDDDEKEAIWLAGLPDDEGLLAALGRVAIIQSWVHYALRMWVGSLCDLSGQAALDATARQTFKGLRQRVRRLFAKRFGEGKPLCQLDALLRRAERATERRNTYHHAIWAVSPDGSEAALHHDEDSQWTAAPTTAQMKGLAQELDEIFQALHRERLWPDGFLYQLLDAEKENGVVPAACPPSSPLPS